MTSEPVIYEQPGRVVVLTLNRSATRNALDASMVNAIVDGCSRIDADAGVSCVVLRSSGPAFCAGGNVKDMKAGIAPFAGTPAEMRRSYRRYPETAGRGCCRGSSAGRGRPK